MPTSADMEKGMIVFASSSNQYFYKGRISSLFCSSDGLEALQPGIINTINLQRLYPLQLKNISDLHFNPSDLHAEMKGQPLEIEIITKSFMTSNSYFIFKAEEKKFDFTINLPDEC